MSTDRTLGRPKAAGSGGVQSLHRGLDLLEIVVRSGGHLSVAEIAAAARLPTPTAHRLLRTLAERGYVRQLSNRRYMLGFQLVPMGAAANAMVGANLAGILADLVAELGETANLAIFTGDRAEYVAQAPSKHFMRMFIEVGQRVELHCSAVGKAMLSELDDTVIDEIVRRTGLPAHTPHTLTDEAALRKAIQQVRVQGYAIDDQEQEIGVRCVAVPAPERMAISVSGPVTRITDEAIARAVPLLHAAARRVTDEIASVGANRR